jgi:ATP adenylyltransferase
MCLVMNDRSTAFYNEPISETVNFSVIPSLGSLVHGWLLLVPRLHVPSLAHLDLDVESELEDLFGWLSSLVADHWKPAVSFEHGPSGFGSDVGCTVDHAHLHLLPNLPNWTIDQLVATAPDLEWSMGRSLVNSTMRGRDYLMVRAGSEIQFGSGAPIRSQHFRRFVAAEIGIPWRWDWRQYPLYGTIRGTYDTIGVRIPKSA